MSTKRSLENNEGPKSKKLRSLRYPTHPDRVKPDLDAHDDDPLPTNSATLQRLIYVPNILHSSLLDAWSTVNSSLATCEERVWFAGGGLNEDNFIVWLCEWQDHYNLAEVFTPEGMLKDWLSYCKNFDQGYSFSFNQVSMWPSRGLSKLILRNPYCFGDTYVSVLLSSYNLYLTFSIGVLWIYLSMPLRTEICS